MPFVSGEILTPKKNLGPIPPSKKLSGTYSNFPKNCVGLFPPLHTTQQHLDETQPDAED